MEFEANKTVTIKFKDRMITLQPGESIDLPEKFSTHPALICKNCKINMDLDINKDNKVDEKDYQIMSMESGKHYGKTGGRPKKSKKKAK